ncbi:hypothetical protein GFS24_06550 [Chitinophaga sp. SYP-B3965]|uniref:hypothetical protein n=1 Tax=Chitinophaga sp. SYP-B3965 TaxID=2663120 RepID=UPI0012997210|nr:hypothetical protein [Chitinophaga sp. SYP-B3965]MRG44765.1 hypothetical protein [Chitinophaga sp. SYP-B3965]
MKKIAVVICFMLGGFAFNANAQVSINVNIGSQPAWGPVGYDYAEYYYLPDVDAYYYIPDRQFIYLNGNRWVRARALPAAYHYDLYSGYKVVVNEPRPYLRPVVYREKYGKYKGWYGKQTIIRDSPDKKYHGKGNKGGKHGKGHKKH